MLSITSEHALRALTHLARLPEGASAPGRTLAAQTGIPANYLSKILWMLGNAGIIDATRGNGGGYRLKRKPGDIKLTEIVELFEKPKLARLVGAGHPCHENANAAEEAWCKVRGAYLEFLRTTTLAEISQPGRYDVAESSH